MHVLSPGQPPLHALTLWYLRCPPRHRSSAAYVDRLGRVNPNVVTDARAPVAAASAPSGRRVNAPGDQKNLHRPSRVRTPERDEGGAGQKGKASELIRAGPDRRREDEARERQVRVGSFLWVTARRLTAWWHRI